MADNRDQGAISNRSLWISFFGLLPLCVALYGIATQSLILATVATVVFVASAVAFGISRRADARASKHQQ